ncbi:MAG: esterase-like activity of phytase family protein [Pseudolabrys sp.]
MTGWPAQARRPDSAIRTTAVAALLIAGAIAIAQAQHSAEAPRAIAVMATPIASFDIRDASRTRFGALEFRGGLELTSNDKDFGGLSALRVSADGARFVSLSDKGRWFRGRLTYRDGRLDGIADAETAPILGGDGTPLAAHGRFDTESLAQDDGTFYVGIERVNEVWRFDYGKDGLLARGAPVAVPPGVKALPHNKGLEAMAFVPRGQSALGGTLIAISERGLDRAGNILGFLIGGALPGSFTVRRLDNFDISDAELLPGGDLLLLERRFTYTSGIALRIRRVRQGDVRPGALIDGRVLMQADMGYQIDNMEGLAAHRNAQGETILTLVSDDNFSIIQRTILLQFALTGE